MYFGKWLRQKIADAVRRISEIPDQINKIEERSRQHREAIPATSVSNNEDEIKRKFTEKVFAASQITEDDKTKRDAHSYSVQNSIRIATWVAALGALFYGAVATYQAVQMRKATEAATKSADIAACALKESQNQFSNTLEQMKAQTAAQNNSASSASAAVSQGEKFFDLQNRPWLVFTPGAIHIDPTSQQVFFEADVKNIGITPAPNAWMRVHYEINQSTPERLRFSRNDKIKQQLYASQQSQRLTGSIPPSSVHIYGPSAYICGWVVYRDVFKGTHLHLTEFGAVVAGGIMELSEPLPSGGLNHPLHISFHWKPISGLSCFDENCKDYGERIIDLENFVKTGKTPRN